VSPNLDKIDEWSYIEKKVYVDMWICWEFIIDSNIYSAKFTRSAKDKNIVQLPPS